MSEDVGGSFNGFTARDTTAYYEIVPANHLERLLFAEAERMGSLVVDQATFESERDVVKEEALPVLIHELVHHYLPDSNGALIELIPRG